MNFNIIMILLMIGSVGSIVGYFTKKKWVVVASIIALIVSVIELVLLIIF